MKGRPQIRESETQYRRERERREEEEKRRLVEAERQVEAHRERLKLDQKAKIEAERHTMERVHLARMHELQLRHLEAEHELETVHFQKKLDLIDRGASFDGNGGAPSLVLTKARGKKAGESIQECLKSFEKAFGVGIAATRAGPRPRGKARRGRPKAAARKGGE